MLEEVACIHLQLKKSQFISEPDKLDNDMNNGWSRDGRTDKWWMEQKFNVFLPYIKYKWKWRRGAVKMSVQEKNNKKHLIIVAINALRE